TGALEAPADTGEQPAADEGELIVEDSAEGDIVEDPVEDPIEDPVEDPQPKPKPKPQGDKPKPAPKPTIDPVATLKDARKQTMGGNPKQGYNLAKDAYDAGGGSDAATVMVIAACKMGSASKAKSAYKKVSAKDKPSLQKICSPLGIELE
ncbi:MAG: hypothetical protein HC927_08545, partial [Deltaproteobacteria bacterium]|nr:hypothetical protein [Deltaproteobacteria bacterium]